MMLVPRVAATFLSPPFAPLSPFRFATRMLREEAAGDHFIVPRTPFRMVSNAIHIRPSSKAGLCPIYSGLRFNGIKSPRKRYFHIFGFAWSVLAERLMFDPGGVGEWSLSKFGMISPPLGDLGGRREIENHHLFIWAIYSLTRVIL